MMRIKGYRFVGATLLVLAALVGVTAASMAAPNPNSAILGLRIFNDCSGSTLVTNNSYPALISMSDDPLGCTAFANLHNWTLSEDGANPAIYMNGDVFEIGATLVIDGPGQAEAGMRISPWWSPDVDGRFQVRTTDGKVECWGGVLPYHDWTAGEGIVYVKGNPISLKVSYTPNANSSTYPAFVYYELTYGSTTYNVGPLAFGNCNAAEEPLYGCYGTLNYGRLGGFFQPRFGTGDGNGQEVNATWSNITYTSSPTSAKTSTWGRLKTLYR